MNKKNRNAKKQKNPEIKAIYYEVNPLPCNDPSLINEHLDKFVKQFIIKRKCERVRTKMLDNLHIIEGSLDPEKTVEIEGQKTFPQMIGELLGDKPSLHFSGRRRKPCFLTAKEVASLSSEDGLLSLVPGQLCLFRHHEDYIYLCSVNDSLQKWRKKYQL